MSRHEAQLSQEERAMIADDSVHLTREDYEEMEARLGRAAEALRDALSAIEDKRAYEVLITEYGDLLAEQEKEQDA